jgi:transposase
MARPLSIDLRVRVAVALAEGETVRAAARRFGVSVASAVRIGQRQCAGRGRAPGKIGGVRRAALAGETGEGLLGRLAEKPDLTMRALTAELAARGVHVAHDTVWCFVRKSGQTIKKDVDGGGAVSPAGGAVPGALAGASTPT